MSQKRLQELESKLTLQQQKAALLLVENELVSITRKTQDQISEELGIDRSSLYRWRTNNHVFIEYMNLLADDMLSAHRSEVYSQLLKLVRGPQPSVKAIDLFMRRYGLLTDRQITQTETSDGNKSNEDLEKELAELDDLLKE
jgi:hypothetical protein